MSLLSHESLPSIQRLKLSYNNLGDVSIRAVFSQSLIRFVSSRKEVNVNVQGMGVEGIEVNEWKGRVLLSVVCYVIRPLLQ